MPETALLHMPVDGLSLPQPVTIGHVKFHPASTMYRMREQLRAAPFSEIMRRIEQNLDRYTIASVRIRHGLALGERREEQVRARATIQDALAVLRLFQVARYPILPVKIQTFGLAGDVTGALENYWLSRRGRIIRGGASWMRGPADWAFSTADIAALREDARFEYLHRALRRTRPTPFQSRAINASRLLSLAILEPTPAVEVVLLATAVEALYGDDPDPNSNHQGAYFRASQRAAFLSCAMPDHPHVNREVCPYLTVTSRKALKNDLQNRAAHGNGYFCDWFEDVTALMDNRHAALHRARSDFDRKSLSGFRSDAEHMLLYGLEWVARNRVRKLSDLDGAIRRYVNPREKRSA